MQQHPELQMFFDAKEEIFPDIGELSKIYSTLPGNDVRSGFLKQNPQLTAYWDWRNSFLGRNPNLAPYIDDDFQPNYGSVEEMRSVEGSQPNFTWMEWQFALPSTLQDLLVDYYNTQEPLPDTAMDELEDIAEGMGLTYDELIDEIAGSYYQAVP